MVIAFVLALAAADANTTVAAPAPPPVPSPDGAVKAEAAKPEPFPLKGNVSVTNGVGSSTFDIASVWNPTINSTLTLAPSARIGAWGLSVRETLFVEWTQGYTTYANQILLSDFTVIGTYGGFNWADAGLDLNLGASADLPLSLVSRHTGKLFGVKTSATASWTHSSGLSLGGTLGLGYNQIVREISQRFADDPGRPFVGSNGETITPRTCLARSQAEILDYACSVIPTIAAGSVTLNAAYSMLENKLNFGGAFTYGAGVSAYLAPNDEFTSPNAVPGPVLRNQNISVDLSASYTVTDWFVFSAGFQSAPPLLGAQPTQFRTPFFDMFTPERQNNFSSLYVDTSFTF